LTWAAHATHAIPLPKLIQLRRVPDVLHRGRKARAAMAGMSWSDYRLAEIKEMAERPTLAELRDRLHTREAVTLPLDSAGPGKRTARCAVNRSGPHRLRLIGFFQTAAGQQIESRMDRGGESLHAPHLFDFSTLRLRKSFGCLVREGAVSGPRAAQSIQALLDLRVTRDPHFVLLPRLWRRGEHRAILNVQLPGSAVET
jgi:antitoxin FitA